MPRLKINSDIQKLHVFTDFFIVSSAYDAYFFKILLKALCYFDCIGKRYMYFELKEC